MTQPSIEARYRAVERERIMGVAMVLEENGFNAAQIASTLGMHPTSMKRLLQKGRKFRKFKLTKYA